MRSKIPHHDSIGYEPSGCKWRIGYLGH